MNKLFSLLIFISLIISSLSSIGNLTINTNILPLVSFQKIKNNLVKGPIEINKQISIVWVGKLYINVINPNMTPKVFHFEQNKIKVTLHEIKILCLLDNKILFTNSLDKFNIRVSVDFILDFSRKTPRITNTRVHLHELEFGVIKIPFGFHPFRITEKIRQCLNAKISILVKDSLRKLQAEMTQKLNQPIEVVKNNESIEDISFSIFDIKALKSADNHQSIISVSTLVKDMQPKASNQVTPLQAFESNVCYFMLKDDMKDLVLNILKKDLKIKNLLLKLTLNSIDFNKEKKDVSFNLSYELHVATSKEALKGKMDVVLKFIGDKVDISIETNPMVKFLIKQTKAIDTANAKLEEMVKMVEKKITEISELFIKRKSNDMIVLNYDISEEYISICSYLY